MEGMRMHTLLKSISNLECIIKERLNKDSVVEFERLKLLEQLVRFGVCTCQCHFSTNVSHSAAPCCVNARMTAE
jgi:hypothetical protein